MTFSLRRALFFFAGVLFCAGCVRSGPGSASSKLTAAPPVTTSSTAQLDGDGQGFGGDPKALALMETARGKVIALDAGTLDRKSLDSLCRFDGCNPGDDTAVCEAVSNITADQAVEIRDFVWETRSQRQTFNSDPKAPIVIAYKELPVDDPEHPGQTRIVDARTTNDPRSAMEFYIGLAFSASSAGRLAVLFHEMGHKVQFRGKPITDYVGTATFPQAWGGQAFLDAAGACAAYATYHRRSIRLGVGIPGAAKLVSTSDGTVILDLQPFPSTSAEKPDVRVAVGDVTGDGVADLVVGNGPGQQTGGLPPTVRAYDGVSGKLVLDLTPFPPLTGHGQTQTDWRGVMVAVGDVDGDGRKDIVAANNDAKIKVIDVATQTVTMTIDVGVGGGGGSNYDTAPVIAVGDLNGDGYDDIVVALNDRNQSNEDLISVYKGGPRQSTPVLPLLYSFHAFPGPGNGAGARIVSIAVGDVNGDGKLDIICVGLKGNGMLVRSFDNTGLGTTNKIIRDILLPSLTYATVASADVDRDAVDDYIFGANNQTASQINFFSGKTGEAITGLLANFVPFLNSQAWIQKTFVGADR